MNRLPLGLSLALALLLAGCGTPGAPRPSHSAKIGPRPASAKLDALTAWTDESPVKVALVSFVDRTTAPGSADFIAPSERVAVLSTELLLLEDSSRLPLRQLAAYLRSSGFRVCFVANTDPEPFRVLAKEIANAAPDDVLGPYAEANYVVRDGRPEIVAVSKPAATPKPIVIHRFVGRRPVLAFGGSGADAQMMEYTTLANPRPSAAFLIGRSAFAGEAAKRGWTVVVPAEAWAPAKG